MVKYTYQRLSTNLFLGGIFFAGYSVNISKGLYVANTKMIASGAISQFLFLYFEMGCTFFRVPDRSKFDGTKAILGCTD
jgi:hypothetical protein